MSAVAPIAALEHTVVAGEVLSGIAQRHSTSVQVLVDANSIADPNMIFAGQTLTIPDTPGSSSDRPGAHTVRSGDNLWAVARQYGVPLGALARINDIEGPALIFPGQVLTLPDPNGGAGPDGAATEPTAGEERPAEANPARYTVTTGDSMWAIAGRFGTPLDELLEWNRLKAPYTVRPGQQIVLAPATPSSVADALRYQNLPVDLANDNERLKLMEVFDRWAGEYDVPPELVKALAWFESGWNNDVESSAGALGIGQVLPITASFISEVLIGEDLDVADPSDNIQLSTRYLRYLIDNSDDLRSAVASYYQGLTATRQHGIYTSSEFYVDGILALRARFE